MTRRLAGQPSLSPCRRSPASHRQSQRSSRGRQSSPPFWTRAPNRHSSLSSSRSPSPQGRRTCSLSSRCQCSWSSSQDRISRPHAADQRFLRLRVNDGDQHPRDSLIPDQSKTVDDSQLSAEKVQKLFADLLDPPALSHYADPLPDSTPSNQLVPCDRTSSCSAAPRVSNIEPLDDLIQRANCTALEAHLMAHDAGVTSTKLFTHLHMLRRRTVLESLTVDLPQGDKDRLLVMSVGGNDLFGPDARKVHEWKRDTEEEKVKLISRVFDEREQRDKAKKKHSSSNSHPPRSLSHRSPLKSISRPRPKDSYNQQPGQSFRRPPKQSPYKSRTGAQSKSQIFNRDKKTSSSKRSDNHDQGQRHRDREPKGSQSARPFHKKGRGGGSGQGQKLERPASCLGKLAHYQAHWTKLFPQHPEIVRKVSQGIIIAFGDLPPSLLRYPLELPSNNKTADLLHAVQKLQVSQAIEEGMDTASPLTITYWSTSTSGNTFDL